MNDAPPRKLHRSRDSTIGGVAGGIAEYLDLDPTLMRLLFVAAFFLGLGSIVIIYVVLWFVMPPAPASDAIEHRATAQAAGGTGARSTSTGGADPAFVFGILLVGVGLLLLVGEFGLVNFFGPLMRLSWPVLLVVVGAALLLRGRDRARS
ncbi:MAG: PspC domain-containing protein [Dehalococcoidia bacterium]|nr:PspC domain-containing protein [Dehalococcoidia bacterium]